MLTIHLLIAFSQWHLLLFKFTWKIFSLNKFKQSCDLNKNLFLINNQLKVGFTKQFRKTAVSNNTVICGSYNITKKNVQKKSRLSPVISEIKHFKAKRDSSNLISRFDKRNRYRKNQTFNSKVIYVISNGYEVPKSTCFIIIYESTKCDCFVLIVQNHLPQSNVMITF